MGSMIFIHGKVSLIRRFTALGLPFLLALSLLMLLVGSAWHVHDHHHGEADSCLWCLAAMVVVVLAALILRLDPAAFRRGFIPLILTDFFASLCWSPRASRAPPTL